MYVCNHLETFLFKVWLHVYVSMCPYACMQPRGLLRAHYVFVYRSSTSRLAYTRSIVRIQLSGPSRAQYVLACSYVYMCACSWVAFLEQSDPSAAITPARCHVLQFGTILGVPLIQTMTGRSRSTYVFIHI